MKDFANAAGSMRALMNANDIARFRDGNIKMSQQLQSVRMSQSHMSDQANEVSEDLNELKKIWDKYTDVAGLVSARLLNNIDTTHSMLRSREYWASGFAANCCLKLLLSPSSSNILQYPFTSDTDRIRYNIFATVSLMAGLRVAFDAQMQLAIEQVLVKEYLGRIQNGASISHDRDKINSGLMAIKKSMDYLTNRSSLMDVAKDVFAKIPANVSLNQLWTQDKPTTLLKSILIEALSPFEIIKKHCPEILNQYNSELIKLKYIANAQDWCIFLDERIEFLTGYKKNPDGSSTLALLSESKDSRLTEEDKILMGSNSEEISNNPKFRW